MLQSVGLQLDMTERLNNNIATEQAIPKQKGVSLLCSQFCGPGIRVSSREGVQPCSRVTGLSSGVL